MINAISDRCVQILVHAAGLLGISYKAINLWVFVIIWPIFTLALMGVVIAQHVRIRRLRKKMEQIQERPIDGG